jgi:hypothetical protein
MSLEVDLEGDHGPDDVIPPEAVRGAWRVGPDGAIVGDFVQNPDFRSD